LDKAKTKAILQSQDLPTPHYHLFTSNSEKKDKLEFPLIVKPVHEDASIGITPNSVTHNEQELLGQVNFILSTYNQPALVEEFIDGKEIKYQETTDEEIEPIMRKWFHKVARFETFNDVNGKNDGSGDQYYFWTHFFAACIFESDTLIGKIAQKTFEKGV